MVKKELIKYWVDSSDRDFTTINLNARYPDYKQEFYKKCTKGYTKTNLEKIKELRVWIKKQIQNYWKSNPNLIRTPAPIKLLATDFH